MLFLASFVLSVTGYVPVICNYNGERMFCNDPNGFNVYSVSSSGDRTLIDSGSGPTNKQITYSINGNEYILIVAR